MSAPPETKRCKLSTKEYSRILGTGKCLGTTIWRDKRCACACPEGIFLAFGSALENKCHKCGHLLVEHQDFPTDLSIERSEPTKHVAESRKWMKKNKALICLRYNTVSKLADTLDSHEVVQVIGTPASGKTFLSELLRNFYLERNRTVFLLKSWDRMDLHGDAWDELALRLERTYPGYSYKDFFAPQTVIIIDEAQRSYDDIDFWNIVIRKRLASEGHDIKICLFSRYGSPFTGVEELFNNPAKFGAYSHVGLTALPTEYSIGIGLFYTTDEFEEVVSLLSSRHAEKFRLDSEARKYLYELTDGHPAGVAALVSYFHHMHREDLKNELYNTITRDQILRDIKDEAKVFNYLESQPIVRSFPGKSNLTPPAADTLIKILEEGSVPYKTGAGSAGLKICYKNSWVQRVGRRGESHTDLVVLPSRLHEKYIEHHFNTQAKPFPPKIQKLDDLALKILRQFSRATLEDALEGNPIFPPATMTSIKTTYQNEFYRGFNQIAGRGVPISREWSRTSDGRVTFYIPQKKWAIEIVSNLSDDNLKEYLGRFKQGGKYWDWIEEGKVEDWVVINFTTEAPKAGSSDPKLWHAVFENAYKTMRVLTHKKKPVNIRLKK
ncbi:hypothetical protein BJY04DRAFT_183395 [Aspergillus karnatakaensis]|uniref:ATP-binding protein n=1 Tax=Aspergillus karnatakaensis TaxID=1810916 RepID=UPI003CCE16C6